MKRHSFLDLREGYIEQFFCVKDQFLQRFVTQSALHIIGECTADNKQQRRENRETEIVLLDERRSILIEKFGVEKDVLVGLRNLLSHTKDCKTILARTITEGNDDYFDRFFPASNHGQTLFQMFAVKQKSYSTWLVML
jgi:hypothetical protein